MLPPDPLDYSPTAGSVNLAAVPGRLAGAVALQILQIRGKWGQIHSRVIGADQRRACFVAFDAETLPVLAQWSLSFSIQYGGITVNSILRSIRRIFIVVALLLVIVVPMSAPPSTSARPDVGLGAASEAPTNQIIIKYKATADISGVKAPAHPDRISTLSAVAGVQLEYFREMSGDAHVLRLPSKLAVSEMSLIAEKLMTLGDIEYA